MYLTRHQSASGPRWACDGLLLPEAVGLATLLSMPVEPMRALLAGLPPGPLATGPLLAPIDPEHEVWASGVTYLRSRDARNAESATGDVYLRVYEAERPELFLKATGRRCVADGQPIGVRGDSTWDVPEPELTLVFNSGLEIVGYCAGDDVSSRSIEGENPLYLPQAKTYTASCALGPGIILAAPRELAALPIGLQVGRGGATVFRGETSTASMRRGLGELVAALGRCLEFPAGGLLMTGTGIVPPDSFTLQAGDVVEVQVGPLRLTNPVVMVAAGLARPHHTGTGPAEGG